MRIAVGCDQGGFALKQTVFDVLDRLGYGYQDFGTMSEESCDYPDFAIAVSEAVSAGDFERGILLCGTGIGMAICANKIKGIRAAVCNDVFSAKATSAHNNSNILTIGARVASPDIAKDIVHTWLTTPFEGGRHKKRIDKIAAVEKEYFKP